jgi:hypothetical protein
MNIVLFIVLSLGSVFVGRGIAGRIVRLLARRWWNGEVSFYTRHYGKYGYARGFAFFEGETAFIGRRTCILTIIYYAIALPIMLLLIIGVMPGLINLLQP